MLPSETHRCPRETPAATKQRGHLTSRATAVSDAALTAQAPEWLEPRCLLAAPDFGFNPPTNLAIPAGVGFHQILQAEDPDGDPISFSVEVVDSDIPGLVAAIPQGNRSLRFSVSHESTVPGDPSIDPAFNSVFTLELLEDIAPATTSKVINLVEQGAYDGLEIFRIVANGVFQFGDPNNLGTGGTGTRIDDEFSVFGQHVAPGFASTAKSVDDTFDMQIFITLGATRGLDFNHVPFGIATSVTQDFLINNVAVQPNPVTGENSFPINPVTINNVELFEDTSNGVLRLRAPHGAVGTATLNVVATDSNGESTSRLVTVNFGPDENALGNEIDSSPFFSPDPVPQITQLNTATSFVLQAVDVEDDPLEFLEGTSVGANNDYEVRGLTKNPNLLVDVNPSTGQVTVTPTADIVGTFPVLLKVRQVGGSPEDFQLVPITVLPTAPSSITLLSDTGTSPTDGLTNINNSGGVPLDFRITGVTPGVEVELLLAGQVVGTAVAAGTSVDISMDGVSAIPDGDHSFTARQVVRNTLEFGNFGEFLAESAPAPDIVVTVVSSLAITSSPPLLGNPGVPYQYDVESTGEAAGGVTYSLQTFPVGMVLLNAATGQVAWTPSPNQSGGNDVVVRVADAAGNSATQSFQVSVNSAPSIGAIADQDVDEGATLTIDVAPLVFDGDPGETFTFAPVGTFPTNASFNAAGLFTFTPDETQGGASFPITVRVTDSRGASDDESFIVNVIENDQAPIVPPVADRQVLRGETVQFLIPATDPDIPALPFVYSLAAGAPAGASIDANSGLFTFASASGDALGAVPITVNVAGPGAGAPSTAVSFNVEVVDNLDPIINPIADQTVAAGEELFVDVVGVDPDPVPQPIGFVLVNGAPPFVSIDAVTGRIGIMPPAETPTGAFTIDVRVFEIADPDRSSTTSFELQVLERANQAPVVAPVSRLSVIAGRDVSAFVAAFDPDTPPAPLRFTLDTPTSEATIDPVTGELRVAPLPTALPGVRTFTVRVSEVGPGSLATTRDIEVEVLGLDFRDFLGIGDSRFDLDGSSPFDGLTDSTRTAFFATAAATSNQNQQNALSQAAAASTATGLSGGLDLGSLNFGADTGLGRMEPLGSSGTSDDEGVEQASGEEDEDADSGVAPATNVEPAEGDDDASLESSDAAQPNEDESTTSWSLDAWDDPLVEWADPTHWSGSRTSGVNGPVARWTQMRGGPHAGAARFDGDLLDIELQTDGAYTRHHAWSAPSTESAPIRLSTQTTAALEATDPSLGTTASAKVPAAANVSASRAAETKSAADADERWRQTAAAAGFYVPMLVSQFESTERRRTRLWQRFWPSRRGD